MVQQYLGQGAVEHNPGAGPETYIYNGHRSHKSRPEDPTCTVEIMQKEIGCTNCY